MIDFPEFQNIRKVAARERIPFSCTGCANCCKNVRDSILLNPLELPIGVVTSFVGAIVFVVIFYQSRKEH